MASKPKSPKPRTPTKARRPTCQVTPEMVQKAERLMALHFAVRAMRAVKRGSAMRLQGLPFNSIIVPGESFDAITEDIRRTGDASSVFTPLRALQILAAAGVLIGADDAPPRHNQCIALSLTGIQRLLEIGGNDAR